MYKVTVEGVAVVGTKLKQIEPFIEEFDMEEGREAYARVIIHRHLIEPRLRQKLTNFRRVKECQIISMEEVEGNIKADARKIEELIVEAIDLNCLPPTLDKYATDKLKIKLIKAAISKRKKKLADKKAKERKLNPIRDEGYIDA